MHSLEESKIIWIISAFLFIVVVLLIVLILVYIRNTYNIYKELLLVEAIIKEEIETK